MCITTNVLEKVKSTIEEYNMISQGDTVILGVSGGADSVMLLHVLLNLRNYFSFNLKVAHINHKIRNVDADTDALFVEKLCFSLDVDFYLKESFIPELAKELGVSEEEAGRKVRYDFFRSLAGSTGKIVTAHNSNDNVETVLMRFMRGTSVKGLGGINYKRDNVIRPLLNVSRSDIEAYILENGLTHITDNTNFEPIYTRNKVRLNLIPEIQSVYNPNFLETVTLNIISYKEDSDFLDCETDKVMSLICHIKDTSIYCDKFELQKLHPSIAKRVIIKCIKLLKKSEQIDVSPRIISKLYTGLTSKVGTVFVLNDNNIVRVDYSSFVFEKAASVENLVKAESHFFKLCDDLIISLDNLNIKVTKVFCNSITNTMDTFYIPCSAITPIVEFRTRNAGDILRVSDNLHKKLNKFFIDKKIPSLSRDSILLMLVNSEVYWVPHYFSSRFENRVGEFFKLEVIS